MHTYLYDVQLYVIILNNSDIFIDSLFLFFFFCDGRKYDAENKGINCLYFSSHFHSILIINNMKTLYIIDRIDMLKKIIIL